MANRRVGIRQIAEMANVDISTVSRALSGSNRVNPKTRQYILGIANEMHYKPNALARGLVCGKTQSVGIIVPEISNTFYVDVVSSLEKVLSGEGYSILLGLSHYDAAAERECVNLFETKMVDGMILFSGNENEKTRESSLKGLNIPLVIMDYGIGVQNADVVASNHIIGVKLGVDYLVETLGHRRIAFVTDNVTTTEREDAFRIYTKERGLKTDQFIIRTTEKYEKGGYEAVQLLFDAPDTPTAIFCTNDYKAIGVMKALKDRGLRIPEDVSVMGFDDATLLNYLDCPLTTIRQHKHRLGEEAGRILLQRMNSDREDDGQDDSFVNITIRPELVIRSSTGPAPNN